MGNKIVEGSSAALILITILALALSAPPGQPVETMTIIYPSPDFWNRTAGTPRPPLLMADQNESSRPKSEREAAQDPESADSRPSDRNQSGSAGGSTKKPATPFNPTERIKADQAVDFPSDI